MKKLVDAIDMAIGARIAARRRGLRLTQRQLAAALGVSFQQIQKYEAGLNRTSASMLVKLAAGLDVTVSDLVGESAAETPRAGAGRGAGPDHADLIYFFDKIGNSHARQAVIAIAELLSNHA